MATENQQITEEKPSEPPSDSELFAVEVHDQPPDREIFTGDQEFFKQLADTGQTAEAQRAVGTSQSPPLSIRRRRFSTIQIILLISIVMTAAMLSYALFKSTARPGGTQLPTPADQTELTASQEFPAELKVEGAHPPVRQLPKEPELTSPPMQALSLKVAETLYQEKSYKSAFAAYNQLGQALPTSPQEDLIKDFLQLRMALCMKKASDLDQANRLLRTVSQSRSPVIRALANYHLSPLEMQRKQYLKAQTRAYQAIALIDAVNSDGDWVAPLRYDCHFLVAESITRNILALSDADKDLPPKLWSAGLEADPFVNLTEAGLHLLLNSGIDQLSKGLLGPQIQEIISHDIPGPRCWSVICHGTPIEEVLTRFAANADFDVCWAAGLDSVGIRRRPVSLYLPTTTTRQLAKVAAGCASLLAHLDENGVVNISNPADYSSLSQHMSLLIDEAISLWQRFLLTFHDDRRVPDAHFALGLLQTQKGQVTDAIAEYKLVANRFSHSSLAPFALLHSGKLKTNLHDYLGARDDLEQLIERDPDTEIANQACLYLADVTMKAGLKTEAAQLYRKVYYLGFSLQAQTRAAFAAGRCFYQMKEFQSSTEWLTRFISLTKDHTSKDLYSAYYLLGKSYLALGKPPQACHAFQYALAGHLSKEEYLDTVSGLVATHLKQGNYIEALDTLESIQSWQLSEEEAIETLLLKCEILRTMGAVDKAAAALRDRAEYISDTGLKTKISFELAKCHIVEGNLELARNELTEILVNVDPGPLAHEIGLKLADVCLKLGQSSQAVSVCLQILNSRPLARAKQEALKALATAYNRQKKYDKAALALSGQWNKAEIQSEKTISDDTATIDKSPTETK